MTRIAKVPDGSTFRARLAEALDADDVGTLLGVGLDTDGRLVKGDGEIGMVGVVSPLAPMAIGDWIDVFRVGATFADFEFLADGETETVAGTRYYADGTTGAVDDTDTGTAIGFTLEQDAFKLLVLTISGQPDIVGGP